MRIHDAIEDAGLEVGAIYHSHTRSDAGSRRRPTSTSRPSPDALYLIAGSRSDEADVRAWRIIDGEVSEAQLEVEEG